MTYRTCDYKEAAFLAQRGAKESGTEFEAGRLYWIFEDLDTCAAILHTWFGSDEERFDSACKQRLRDVDMAKRLNRG